MSSATERNPRCHARKPCFAPRTVDPQSCENLGRSSEIHASESALHDRELCRGIRLRTNTLVPRIRNNLRVVRPMIFGDISFGGCELSLEVVVVNCIEAVRYPEWVRDLPPVYVPSRELWWGVRNGEWGMLLRLLSRREVSVLGYASGRRSTGRECVIVDPRFSGPKKRWKYLETVV